MNIKIEILQSKNGSNTLKLNNLLIHSSYNPEKEAISYMKKKYIPHCVHIIFGYGCGHFHEALKKVIKHNEVIICLDPLLDERQISIQNNHLTDSIYGSEKINSLEHIIFNQLNNSANVKYNVISIPRYKDLFPQTYKYLLEKVRDIQNVKRVNNSTVIMYAKDWQKNIKMNLINVLKDGSLKELHNYFDLPIIIASSGPSLKKQLPTLKKYADKLLIISAGSTTKVLLDNEINPDFIISIDGAEANLNHFKDLKIKNSRFIYSFQSHYGIRDSFTQQAFYCNVKSTNGLENYFNSFLQDAIPTLLGGGSVANLSFSVAQYLTSGPIAFIGQDLAYTDNQTHVQGHAHLESVSFEDDNQNKEFMFSEGYYNEKVITSTPLHTMKLSFENMIKIQKPKNIFYNCTEGGVKIHGYDQMPFKEFCEKFTLNSKGDFDIPYFMPVLTSEVLIEKYKEEKRIIRDVIDLCESAKKVLNSNKHYNKFDNSVLRDLEKMEKEIKFKLDKSGTSTILDTVSILVLNSFYEDENETLTETFNRVKNQSLFLYSELENVLNDSLKFLELGLNKLERVIV